jgi:hypothetical protein
MSADAACMIPRIGLPASPPSDELGSSGPAPAVSADDASDAASASVAGKQPHPVYTDRWADGTQRPGFPGPALTHGARSALVRAGELPGEEGAAVARTERQEGIVADLGGEDALSTVARDQAGRYAELSIVADHLWDNIGRNGVLTTKGRQRAALTAYLQVQDRLVRLAQMLGVERKAKRTLSPLDYVNGRDDA